MEGGNLGSQPTPAPPSKPTPPTPSIACLTAARLIQTNKITKRNRQNQEKKIDIDKGVGGKITNSKKPYSCHPFDLYTSLFLVKEMRVEGDGRCIKG